MRRWLFGLSVYTDMDEYDELFEIEDDFENQFADELEALADMEKGEEQQLANTVLVMFVKSFV